MDINPDQHSIVPNKKVHQGSRSRQSFLLLRACGFCYGNCKSSCTYCQLVMWVWSWTFNCCQSVLGMVLGQHSKKQSPTCSLKWHCPGESFTISLCLMHKLALRVWVTGVSCQERKEPGSLPVMTVSAKLIKLAISLYCWSEISDSGVAHRAYKNSAWDCSHPGKFIQLFINAFPCNS